MAPVMISTNMPMELAVPWKMRSDGSREALSCRGARGTFGSAGGAVVVVTRTARGRSRPSGGRTAG
jgi:hypothetical protein